MKFLFLLLLAAFVANCSSAVNNKQANDQEYDLPAAEPTRAPLLTSTAAPTEAPQVQVTPTAKPSIAAEAHAEVFPIELPATVVHPLKTKELEPSAVTGFITKNGNIYEIENENGIGKIESRQANNEGHHICNYGALVVYSDVPCEKVTNIRIREVEEKPAETLGNRAPVVQQGIKPAQNNEKRPNKNNLNRPNTSAQKPTKKPAQNRPKKPAKKPTKKPAQNRPNKPALNRPNKPAHNRPSTLAQNRPNKPNQNRPNNNQLNRPNKRPNKNGQNRPSQNGQKRPIQNGQKRPNKNNLTRPINNAQKRPSNNNKNKSRRIQQSNQRKLEIEEYNDDDDNDDEIYFQGNQRRQQAQRFIYEYEDY